MAQDLSERDIRLQKLTKIKELGIKPYAAKYERSHTLKEASLEKEGTKVKICGRVMFIRDMGKLIFMRFQDFSGQLQVVFEKTKFDEENWNNLKKLVDMADFLGVEGEIFTTHKGEISVLVSNWEILSKALLPLPEKFHGIKDDETILRQRYLDTTMNEDSKNRFVLRYNFIRSLREFYWKKGFFEVETPTFMHNATGADARPYHTHNNALDIDLVLRISHELPLKMMIVGGFEKIFELGKAFRNEGIDPSHLPEHTHLEHYSAYWDFEDNIKFTEEMFDYFLDNVFEKREFEIEDKFGKKHQVKFETPFKRVSYIEEIKKASGIDIMDYDRGDERRLLTVIKEKGYQFEDMDKMLMPTLVDNLYKKLVRPFIINPTVVFDYPKYMQPLARVNDKDERKVDQFQLVVAGWEVVKAYSELVDPVDQKERFLEQEKAKDLGDQDAMSGDDEYIISMEHGMPPISGWGMGVDRVITLLTGQNNLRDLVYFPLIRPRE